jgi:hypothetical protein
MAELPEDEHIEELANAQEAFMTAYNAIEGRRLYCEKCVAELEREASSV